MLTLFWTSSVWALAVLWLAGHAASAPYLSHPSLRQAPPPSRRPMDKGPAYFVDPRRGNDRNDGSEKAPWRTIGHSLTRLSPGDTLCLRGGVYYENVRCSVVGRPDAPITIRSYPGEQAILDGGLREFFESPADAWQSAAADAPGEFRSARAYKNIRDVLGLFGDSMIGLQTYWHAMDLRATNELWIADPDKKIMVLPVYCGPGLWYDKQSGYIHVRLAHTHIANPRVANYRGETDPRKLPLVIAPFSSVPLLVDQAMHVRFQDLVIRGGGFDTVTLQFGVDVEFDNVTVFCATYGLRARGTGPLRFINSALYGMIPPWASRNENGLHTYNPLYYDPFIPPPAGANQRNIARLPTHAVLVTEGSYEFEVFHYPYNHDWEISHSEFTEGHDGIYLSGRNIRFHHNLVENIQDDAVYLSAPSPWFNDNIHVYQNVIRQCLMAFGCHSRGGPTGNTYIYRNLCDLRKGVLHSRPTPEKPEGELKNFHIYLMHGREFLGVESFFFYQNTFISPAWSGAFAHRTLTSTSDRTVRRSFNNLFVYLNEYPTLRLAPPKGHDIQCDGNLHWCPQLGAQPPKDYLDKVRTSPWSEENKKNYPSGWEANSLVGDPKFVRFSLDPDVENDYRLSPDSPAIGKGLGLPADWEDPLRPKDGSRPDIGALPRGGDPLRVGRNP
ncbi:MAG: hypothetical protein FJ278_05240 [Planctomycetes bacterium]|nr:hypothetical protein [Planctomycetota bacterium]